MRASFLPEIYLSIYLSIGRAQERSERGAATQHLRARAHLRSAMDLTAPALGRMVEPSRQERLPRPGRRASNSEPATCGCSHHPTTAASVPPIAQERLYGSAPPMMNVQQEPQAELSLDGDGTLLTDFAPPRVVRRFETNRLSQFLDYGKQLAHRSLGSAYSVVHAADDVGTVRGAPSVNSAFKWPAPEQEGAPSHAHAARFGTDVDWGDGAVPAEIGASRSLDAELEADNAEDPYCPEEARSSPRWRGHGVCCAAGLVGLVLLASSASQGAVVASANDQAAVDNSLPAAGGGAPPRPDADARSAAIRRAVSPPPPPSEHGPLLHYIAYQAIHSLHGLHCLQSLHSLHCPPGGRPRSRPPACSSGASSPWANPSPSPIVNPRRLLLPSAGLTLAPALNPSQLLLTSAAGVPMQDRHDQCTGRRTRGQAGGLRD